MTDVEIRKFEVHLDVERRTAPGSRFEVLVQAGDIGQAIEIAGKAVRETFDRGDEDITQVVAYTINPEDEDGSPRVISIVEE